MARPRRRIPFRRPLPPPPADPYAYERVVEEQEIVERRPRGPADNPFFWLALLGIAAVALALVAVYLATREDERPGRERRVAEMPLAVGGDHVQAATAIEELGLVVDSFPVESAEPAGKVVAQSPEEGVRLPRGSRVRLDVSTGPTAREAATVPDVTGPRGADARERVRAAGFTVRTVRRAAPSPEEVGEVIDQEPAAGSQAPGLSQITLFVGR